MEKYIAYYRVSTKQQGESGLGLEAQKATVARFVKSTSQIINEYTDVESGKSITRPELLKAIQEAKESKAVLLIAKLDRLSRNVHFISSLMQAKVRFKACDLPEADEFTVHLFAALAEKERKMISERTRAGLQALKARGIQLGKPDNLTLEARRKGVETRQKAAFDNKENRQAIELINLHREKGLSYRAIASKLNDSGYTTRRGKTFSVATVQMLIGRT